MEDGRYGVDKGKIKLMDGLFPMVGPLTIQKPALIGI